LPFIPTKFFCLYLFPSFLSLGATAQGELSPPEQSASISLCSSFVQTMKRRMVELRSEKMWVEEVVAHLFLLILFIFLFIYYYFTKFSVNPIGWLVDNELKMTSIEAVAAKFEVLS
jgi:hypothetical protein